MLTDQECQIICQALEDVRSQVVEAALEDQYRNPFWEDRYPERGRTHSRQDNNYHLDFLATALKLDTPSTFADYILWLRPMLVIRGMCTYHLRQNLESLRSHLTSALAEKWPVVEPYFTAGTAALNYQHPACRALFASEQSIAWTTSERMWLSDPAWEQKYGERGRALFFEDNLFHLSYLLDAVSLGQPGLFGKYLAWLSGFLARRGLDPQNIYRDLELLGEEISRTLPEAEARPFQVLLTEQIPK